jgi:hypothetical protein
MKTRRKQDAPLINLRTNVQPLQKIIGAWNTRKTLHTKFKSLGEYLMTRYHNFTNNENMRKTILDYTVSNVSRWPANLTAFKEKYLSDLTQPTREFKQLLDEFNTAIILNIKILRKKTLSSDFIKKFAPELKLEKTYHVGLIFETSKGPLIIEKLPNLKMSRFTGDLSDTELIDCQHLMQFLPYKTVGEYITKTTKKMGSTFFKYSVKDANCQIFVYKSLETLGLWKHLNKKERSFVLQDFSNLSTLKAYLTNVRATLHSRLNIALSRGGTNQKTRRNID